MKIVQKYGGSSLADNDCLLRVAKRILNDSGDNKLLIVVSAQGKTTDGLTEKYREISDDFPSAASDALLCTGEQISAALLTAALKKLGGAAVCLNGMQVPIIAVGNHGDGKIRRIYTGRIRKEWRRGNIVVITGFQGVNDRGDCMTLGRGGSDTSAVALAAALRADKCMIFTDVDGVYSADPRKIPNAKRFESIHVDTMIQLAECGAKVLHPSAAELAKRYCVSTEILTSFSDKEGTSVSSNAPKRTGVTMKAEEDGTGTVTAVLAEDLLPSTVLALHAVSERYGTRMTTEDGRIVFPIHSEAAKELLQEIHDILYPDNG